MVIHLAPNVFLVVTKYIWLFTLVAYFAPHTGLALYPKFIISQKKLKDVIIFFSLKKKVDIFNCYNVVYLDLNYDYY